MSVRRGDSYVSIKVSTSFRKLLRREAGKRDMSMRKLTKVIGNDEEYFNNVFMKDCKDDKKKGFKFRI